MSGTGKIKQPESQQRLEVEDLLYGFIEGVLVVEPGGRLIANDPLREILSLKKRKDLTRSDLEKTALGEHVLRMVDDFRKSEEPEMELEISLIGRGKFKGFLKHLRLNGNREKAIFLILAPRTFSNPEEEDRIRIETLSKVSHEFRTRLAAIRGSIENVTDGLLGEVSPEQGKFLSIAVESVNRLTVLVEELLDPLRIRRDEIRVKKKKMNLDACVESALNCVRAFAQRGEIRLEKDAPVTAPPVYGDLDKIEQVIFNLLENAIKFTQPGGLVKVEIDCHHRTVEVAVTDTGRGMTKEKIAQLFFSKTLKNHDPRIRGGKPGSGLGLRIVQDLLNAHGCQLKVGSQPGKGSRFGFELERFKQG